MSEGDAVRQVGSPRTREGLGRDLARLGIRSGEVLLLHVSLSSLGWVVGREVAVLQAVLDVLGPEGTLAMPAFSSDLTDPRFWENPPIPETWWAEVCEHMPAFDPARTPTRGLGRVADALRTWPGVRRSRHPSSSFAALGPAAASVVEDHGFDHPLGDGSPLERLEGLGARVLLLGVGYDRNTCFHLGEDRAGCRAILEEGGPVLIEGDRTWIRWREPEYCSEDFAAIGAAFEATGVVRTGRVGSAEARLFELTAAARFAEEWFRARVVGEEVERAG